ncbi:MAG: hypothetical protein KJ799_05785 [Bacteroidetes bacterium]|nr:hypothetical protein [Bacteroidota bacterium]
MKRILFLLILITFFASAVTAQQNEKVESLKAATDNIFELSKNKDYKNAADKIAYYGKDAERLFKDHYNYADEKDAAQVKRICKKIKALIDISDSHTFGEITSETKDGIATSKVEVIFSSGEQELITNFLFIEISARLLLFDID